MSSLWFLFFSLFMMDLPAHDAVVALFQLSENDQGLVLEVTFDIEDYQSVYGREETHFNHLKIESYLNASTKWTVNGKGVDLKVQDGGASSDHYRLKFRMLGHSGKVSTLEIENHFLTEVRSHSNLIMVDLNDRFRDFRMHKGRTRILIEY